MMSMLRQGIPLLALVSSLVSSPAQGADLTLGPGVQAHVGIDAFYAQLTRGYAEPGPTREHGYLFALGDVDTLGAAAVELVRDQARHRSSQDAARRQAVERFEQDPVVGLYRSLYADVLSD